jgi:hypothetical protein
MANLSEHVHYWPGNSIKQSTNLGRIKKKGNNKKKKIYLYQTENIMVASPTMSAAATMIKHIWYYKCSKCYKNATKCNKCQHYFSLFTVDVPLCFTKQVLQESFTGKITFTKGLRC